MRSLIIIACGFALLALALLAGRALGARRQAGYAFIAVWFVAAAVNLWIGVAAAGYGVAEEEAPIFLMIFLPPAVAAWLAIRRT
jgi:apolipoprotein N-acyltransferase